MLSWKIPEFRNFVAWAEPAPKTAFSRFSWKFALHWFQKFYFVDLRRKITRLSRKYRFRTLASPGDSGRLAILNWRSSSIHPSSIIIIIIFCPPAGALASNTPSVCWVITTPRRLANCRRTFSNCRIYRVSQHLWHRRSLCSYGLLSRIMLLMARFFILSVHICYLFLFFYCNYIVLCEFIYIHIRTYIHFFSDKVHSTL